MKLKIAGLFRNLLGRTETSQPDAGRPVAPPSGPADAAQAGPGGMAASAGRGPAGSDVSPGPEPEHPDEIAVSLLAITNGLPMDLKAKLMGNPAPGRMIYVPLESVIGQLAFGVVKIPFGELRRLAPGLFVSHLNNAYDSRPVALPLNEILARINPVLLARRPSAHTIEVAEEIAGPFAGQGRGVCFSEQPLQGTPVPSSATERLAKPAPPGGTRREVKPTPATPLAPPRRDIPPSAPISFNPPPGLVPAPPAPADPWKSARNGTSAGSQPGNGVSSGTGNGHGRAPAPAESNKPAPGLPPFKFTTAPMPPAANPPRAASPFIPSTVVPRPTPPASVAPVKPAAPPAAIAVALADLADKWPDEVKGEIFAQGFGNVRLPLPLPAVEPGLKRGRLTLTWRQIRSLIKSDSKPSALDDLELDLPLPVVAPAFLAAQKRLSAQAVSRIAVSEEIPNLFFGFPQPEAPAPAPAPANGGTPPAAPSAPSAPFRPSPLPRGAGEAGGGAPTHASLPARHGDTSIFSALGQGAGNAEDSTLFRRGPAPATDFLTRQMQPKEVVAQALALPGVAGAVVALADGLRVAGEVPPEFNADTVAAFLPQIYERVNQSTRELRMGALNNVGFTVGSVPWKIYRVGSIYFAVFGRPDEVFPKARLAQLAAGLNRKTKA